MMLTTGVLACAFASSVARAENAIQLSGPEVVGTIFDNALDSAEKKPPPLCAKQALWSRTAGYHRPFWFTLLATLHQHPEVEQFIIAIPKAEHENITRQFEYTYQVILEQPAVRTANGWPEEIATLFPPERYTDRVVLVGDPDTNVALLTIDAGKVRTEPFTWCQSVHRAVSWAGAEVVRRTAVEVAARDSTSGIALKPAVTIDRPSDPMALSPTTRSATPPPVASTPAIVAPVPPFPPPPPPPSPSAKPWWETIDEDDEEDDVPVRASASAVAPPPPPKSPTPPVKSTAASAATETDRMRCALEQRLVRGKAVRQPNGTITFVVEIPKDLKCTPR